MATWAPPEPAVELSLAESDVLSGVGNRSSTGIHWSCTGMSGKSPPKVLGTWSASIKFSSSSADEMHFNRF